MIGEATQESNHGFSLCAGWHSDSPVAKLGPAMGTAPAGQVSLLSSLISSPKPVLSLSVLAWKVKVQCLIMTFQQFIVSLLRAGWHVRSREDG